jgi:glycosyltransferase involved in cell wall biosynthesis
MLKKNINYPDVSVIVPCRNEAQHIRQCLDSVLFGGYPAENMEIIVVDGKSDDGTLQILEDLSRDYDFIRILENNKKITPCALNLGIKNSYGKFILWVSAHNKYEKGYIKKCLQYIGEYNADAVGGVIKPVPRNKTLTGNAIALVISSRFGVGNSLHKIGLMKPKWADTAFGICYKREIFEQVGLFNEKLVRGQDMEFALRLKEKGFKTLLVPDLVSYYYLRSDFKSFLKHNFANGQWVILPFAYSQNIPVCFRHIVPMVFVFSLIISIIMVLVGIEPFKLVFVTIILSYCAVNLFFSLQIAHKIKKVSLVPVLFVMFLSLHLSYGLGSLAGLVQVFMNTVAGCVKKLYNYKLIQKNKKWSKN